MAGIQDIRKNLSGTTAKIISWSIIITFALFFGWGTVFSGSDANNVLSVNGKKVDVFDLQNEMASIQQQLRERFDDEEMELDPLLLKQLALNTLISDSLISSYLESKGLEIPDEIAFMVLGLDPAFIENGEFNKERFDLIALQNGLSPNKLLENFKQELMIRYWNLGIGQSELVSGKRFSRSLNLANQTRDITFTRLDFSKEEDNIKVTKESLEEFYNSNQNKFTSNEKFSISYIDISSDQFSEELVFPEDVQSEYEAYVDDFDSSIRRKASHLMINVKENESIELALERIRLIYSKLEDDNFINLVSEFSEDEGSKNSGGDLGISDGTAFPEEFEKALVNLNLGDVSEPIYLADSQSYHLIKLTELISPKPESFEERKEKIELLLVQDKKESQFLESLENLADLSFSLEDLTLIAEELKIQIKTLNNFSLEEVEGLFSEQKLKNVLLSKELEPGQTSEVIELPGNRALVLRVDEYIDPSLKMFEEVKGEVEKLYIAEIAEDSFRNKEQELLQLFNSSNSFLDSTQEKGLNSESYKGLSRNSLLFPRSVLDKIFEIPRSEIDKKVFSSSLTNGDKIIFTLNAINSAEENLSRTEEGDEAFKNFLSQERAQSLLSELQSTLRSKADISTKEVDLISN
tara:strand:- start:90 stop:1997 length:1908 start_codon:yes stop_codon:yes gene_type:complete